MTKITAKASAPHFLPEGATLIYSRPMTFTTKADGGLEWGDYTGKHLRFEIQGEKTERTVVRQNPEGAYFYRDGWPEWTQVMDAESANERKAACQALARLAVDDLPLELGIRMPLAIAMVLSSLAKPIEGMAHPWAQGTTQEWNEDLVIAHYFERLNREQAQNLQEVTFQEKNPLDWALLMRQMKTAESLWHMGVRPSSLDMERGTALWALVGAYSATPSTDEINQRYLKKNTNYLELDSKSFPKALERLIQNPLVSKEASYSTWTPWDTIQILWLERLADLPVNATHQLAFVFKGNQGEADVQVNRTPFHHWLTTQGGTEASQRAWIETMAARGYPFQAPHPDAFRKVDGPDSLIDLARPMLTSSNLTALRGLILGTQLPQVSSDKPKLRF